MAAATALNSFLVWAMPAGVKSSELGGARSADGLRHVPADGAGQVMPAYGAGVSPLANSDSVGLLAGVELVAAVGDVVGDPPEAIGLSPPDADAPDHDLGGAAADLQGHGALGVPEVAGRAGLVDLDRAFHAS